MVNSNSVKYGNSLLNGLNNNVLTTLDWLHTHKYNEFNQIINNTNIENEQEYNNLVDLFSDSLLMNELLKQTNVNKKNIISYVDYAYNYGDKLAYYDLGINYYYQPVNIESLNNIRSFNTKLVDNLNTDFNNALIDTIILTSGYGISRVTSELLKTTKQNTSTNFLPFNFRCSLTGSTENKRAMNTGLLQTYMDSGVNEFNIITADDDSVCDECANNESDNPYEINEVEDIIPVHPGCRCSIKALLSSIKPISDNYLIDLTGDVL